MNYKLRNEMHVCVLPFIKVHVKRYRYDV